MTDVSKRLVDLSNRHTLVCHEAMRQLAETVIAVMGKLIPGGAYNVSHVVAAAYAEIALLILSGRDETDPRPIAEAAIERLRATVERRPGGGAS